MEKVCVLIHNNACSSTSYTTKVFRKLSGSPFYKELENHKIRSRNAVVLAAIIPMKEFKSSIISRIDFRVVVSYQRQGNDYLQQCNDVHVSASEVMGEDFDVLCSKKPYSTKVLAMLSACDKTTLCLKQTLHLSDEASVGDSTMQNTLLNGITPEIFCKCLGLELISGGNVALGSSGESRKVAIHTLNPHHILFGMMIIFHEGVEDLEASEFNFEIDVFARSKSQVLALLHYIYDRIPCTLIVTTPNTRVTSKAHNVDTQEYSEAHDTSENIPKLDSTKFAKSLLKRTKMTLDYFDDCLKAMNLSRDPAIVKEIGQQIDIFAMGLDKFIEYRNKMLAETDDEFTETEENNFAQKGETEKGFTQKGESEIEFTQKGETEKEFTQKGEMQKEFTLKGEIDLTEKVEKEPIHNMDDIIEIMDID